MADVEVDDPRDYLAESKTYTDASKALGVIERLAEEFFSKYDPELFSVTDATVMLERTSKLTRLTDAAVMLCARRLVKVDAHKDQGFKDPAFWLSSITGEPVSQAASKLGTARAVEAHPPVSKALKSGKLSEPQAKEIAAASERRPDKAGELVELSQFMNYSELKTYCQEIRRAAETDDDEITRYERIRKARCLRHWTDSEGVANLIAKMTPDSLSWWRHWATSKKRSSTRHESPDEGSLTRPTY
jgi:hypothetical protein